METNLCVAGFGGQGVMTLGKFLATATCDSTDKNVTFFPSYGAEQRGGTANCFVVISDGLVGADDADTAERREVIAAGENAEVGEHVVRPVAEVELGAGGEPGHVDLLASAFVELEEHAATAVDERVAVFGDDQVDVVVSEEKAQLRVALVGSHEKLDVALFQLGDKGSIEVWRNLEGSVEVVACLVDLPFTLFLLGNFHIALARSSNQIALQLSLAATFVCTTFNRQIGTIKYHIRNKSFSDEFVQTI